MKIRESKGSHRITNRLVASEPAAESIPECAECGTVIEMDKGKRHCPSCGCRKIAPRLAFSSYGNDLTNEDWAKAVVSEMERRGVSVSIARHGPLVWLERN